MTGLLCAARYGLYIDSPASNRNEEVVVSRWRMARDYDLIPALNSTIALHRTGLLVSTLRRPADAAAGIGDRARGVHDRQVCASSRAQHGDDGTYDRNQTRRC
jgi:hypothetical protein